MTFKRIDRSGLSKQVSEQLEAHILRGPLEAGSRLPSEKELGKQFGVSRNAIREALKSLEARGLIRVENGRGAFATAPTSDTVRGALGRYIQARLNMDTIDQLF
jgi:DNA-binding FadR family transcriptional regulator